MPRRSHNTSGLVAAAVVLAAGHAHAYTLFDPVPADALRPIALDRPDITESPITVDAGHFQFEGDVIRWNKDQGTSSIVLWSGLYKLGLTDSLDLQGGVEAYKIERDDSGRTRDAGVGALVLRGKWNVYGNEGDSPTALGLLPYVAAPSTEVLTEGQQLQYGLGVPFSFALHPRYSLGTQSQLDVIPAGGRHRVRFFQSLVLGGALVGPVDFFVEVVASLGPGDNQYLLDGGLIFAISPNIIADVAFNAGLNDATPTRAYLGLSFRV